MHPTCFQYFRDFKFGKITEQGQKLSRILDHADVGELANIKMVNVDQRRLKHRAVWNPKYFHGNRISKLIL